MGISPFSLTFVFTEPVILLIEKNSIESPEVYWDTVNNYDSATSPVIQYCVSVDWNTFNGSPSTSYSFNIPCFNSLLDWLSVQLHLHVHLASTFNSQLY